MSDEMREKVALSASLRRGLEAMACYGSAPMDLWDRFSNDVLKAADEIDALAAELKRVERERDLNRDPMRTWQGACGHIWDRRVEDTDQCQRCAAEARATAAERERDEARAKLADADEYRETLYEFLSLQNEAEAIRGGGPGWSDRWNAAWDRTRELFAP